MNKIYFRKGYLDEHFPSHPNSRTDGTIGKHRLVAEEILGRYLTKREVVHHLDGNGENNTPENIIVFATKADHARFHALKQDINFLEKRKDETYACLKRVYSYICKMCNKTYNTKYKAKTKNTYCCLGCKHFGERRFVRPLREELEKMVWEKPLSHIAKQLGVGDRTISDWCEYYKIGKPTKGYWNKKYACKI